MTRTEICRRIEEVGIVPVVRAPSPELALRAADALLAGGVSIFEITMTVPDAQSVIRSLVARIASKMPSRTCGAARSSGSSKNRGLIPAVCAYQCFRLPNSG